MKKIMFHHKYCLTQAVLASEKTMTRRLLSGNVPLSNWEETEKYLPYKVGEIVAIAQSYHNLNKSGYTAPEWLDHVCESSAGYENKMFVRADLMPHHIKITDIKVERLQDISDDDIMREGIREDHFAGGGSMFFYDRTFVRDKKRCVEPIYNSTARRAFASLMYKIIGGRTWKSNPWVVAYSFELVD